MSQISNFENLRWRSDLHRNITNADATVYCWKGAHRFDPSGLYTC